VQDTGREWSTFVNGCHVVRPCVVMFNTEKNNR
jgi:hypothetical protein